MVSQRAPGRPSCPCAFGGGGVGRRPAYPSSPLSHVNTAPGCATAPSAVKGPRRSTAGPRCMQGAGWLQAYRPASQAAGGLGVPGGRGAERRRRDMARQDGACVWPCRRAQQQANPNPNPTPHPNRVAMPPCRWRCAAAGARSPPPPPPRAPPRARPPAAGTVRVRARARARVRARARTRTRVGDRVRRAPYLQPVRTRLEPSIVRVRVKVRARARAGARARARARVRRRWRTTTMATTATRAARCCCGRTRSVPRHRRRHRR